MSKVYEENEIGMNKLELIDYIRLLKGKNFSISSIATSTGLTTEKVTKLLLEAYDDFDAHFELMSALDEYNAHLNDISLLIVEINNKYKAKEDKNGKPIGNKIPMTTDDAKMLSNLMEKRTQLHEKKVKFIEKLQERPSSKQHSVNAFSKKSDNQITKLEDVETVPIKDIYNTVIKSTKDDFDIGQKIEKTTKTISPKFKCKEHKSELYKILNAFKFQQVNKKNLNKNMKSAKFKKNICSVVKCELTTFKKITRCISKDKIPKPKLPVENELYKYWVGEDYEQS